MNRFLLLFAALLSASGLFAQGVVKGRVTDDSSLPLPAITVSVEGGQVYCSTLEDGSFEIPAKKGDILHFDCIGLQSTSVRIDSPERFLNVVMMTDTQLLEETVVVGYGVTRKRDLAGSVSSIKADEVKAGVITSTADLLRGRAAGVVVKQESFEPGSGMTVRIRGASTISADNTPLYIVDGIQTSLGNQISPEDIESMEILK
ncbi:MAG: TonB-dependent receptor plug domain-containing protein, partial [Candidatus Cryptobacteroides sp.]